MAESRWLLYVDAPAVGVCDAGSPASRLETQRKLSRNKVVAVVPEASHSVSALTGTGTGLAHPRRRCRDGEPPRQDRPLPDGGSLPREMRSGSPFSCTTIRAVGVLGQEAVPYIAERRGRSRFGPIRRRRGRGCGDPLNYRPYLNPWLETLGRWRQIPPDGRRAAPLARAPDREHLIQA